MPRRKEQQPILEIRGDQRIAVDYTGSLRRIIRVVSRSIQHELGQDKDFAGKMERRHLRVPNFLGEGIDLVDRSSRSVVAPPLTFETTIMDLRKPPEVPRDSNLYVGTLPIGPFTHDLITLSRIYGDSSSFSRELEALRLFADQAQRVGLISRTGLLRSARASGNYYELIAAI